MVAGTSFYYAGSDASVVALFDKSDGALLTVTHFGPNGPVRRFAVGIAWDQFRKLIDGGAEILRMRDSGTEVGAAADVS